MEDIMTSEKCIAQLKEIASEMLALLKENRRGITTDWKDRVEEVIAKADGLAISKEPE